MVTIAYTLAVEVQTKLHGLGILSKGERCLDRRHDFLECVDDTASK